MVICCDTLFLGLNKYAVQNVIFRPCKVTNFIQHFVQISEFLYLFSPSIERCLIFLNLQTDSVLISKSE